MAWLSTVDHKRIGILYLVTALVFFVIGGIEAMFIRLQLAVPNNTFLQPDTYNMVFTMHGTTMIFLVAMPALFGLANYVVPLQIGARDMAFPRLNAFSFWLVPFGGLLLHFSFLAGGAPAVGWFAYAPLSETPYSSQLGVDYWALALLVLGIGSVGASINFIVTVLTQRAPNMTLRRLPLFSWMIFVNSFLVILALPVLNAGLVMLLIDRRLGAHFFLPPGGGSAIMWQHIFWAFGHPEVYIVAIPAFGILSEVIPVFSRKPIFGYEFVAGSTVAIAFLSLLVWAHHMFTVGLGHTVDLFFVASSMLIAIPTGVKVLAWSATMVGGRIRLDTPMLFCVAALVQFLVARTHGNQSRRRGARLADEEQLLSGRALSLCFRRPDRFRDSGRAALLVSENERADAFGAAREMDVLADDDRLQPDVHHPAFSRVGRHAAARLYLSRSAGLGLDEHGLDHRRVFHGGRRAAFCVESGRQPLATANPPATIRGTPGRSNGRPPRRRRTKTSTSCRRSAAGVRSGTTRTPTAPTRLSARNGRRKSSRRRKTRPPSSRSSFRNPAFSAC